jgi:hypothetical protein
MDRIQQIAALFVDDEAVEVLATERGAVVRRVFPGSFVEARDAASQWGSAALAQIGDLARLEQAAGIAGLGTETVIEMHFALPAAVRRSL